MNYPLSDFEKMAIAMDNLKKSFNEVVEPMMRKTMEAISKILNHGRN